MLSWTTPFSILFGNLGLSPQVVVHRSKNSRYIGEDGHVWMDIFVQNMTVRSTQPIRLHLDSYTHDRVLVHSHEEQHYVTEQSPALGPFRQWMFRFALPDGCVSALIRATEYGSDIKESLTDPCIRSRKQHND
jgi:hypothetical protein